MNLTLILFLIGVLGFVLNRKNIILMLISIEIMLLAITFLILVSSLNIDDIIGQTYAIYIIVVAGAESAIGLGILVAFYRLINSPVKNPRSNYSYSHFNLLPAISRRRNLETRRSSGYPIRNYSTERKIVLSPSFISGFSDAEGSFVITILKNPRYKIGWNVQARFQIKLHEKDRALLLLIKNYFYNIGYISKINDRSTVEFRVSDITSLNNIIIPHFEKYTLISNKYKDFILFKQIVSLMSENKHTTLEGLKEILQYRASLNWGLSKNLKETFPSIIPVKRVEILDNMLSNLSSDWVAGFSAGESNFFITVSGTKVWLRFSIAQDSRDILLLKSLVEFFNCGYIAQYKNRQICEFIVTKIHDIIIYIIPFFDKYKIEGSKYKNYVNFKEAAILIKNQEHLTEKGLNKIIELKNSMNKND
uniref:NADH dehydrogenase subunit 4L n=1 Tax=Diaporthe sojae TaxID=165439 RepID=UPI00241024FD|nr:NADH dehydrogenase subunit 4L [Diaporthe sojae]WET30429.1 NADH dehydrogenase subunit 4L [Diaporthe sojae]